MESPASMMTCTKEIMAMMLGRKVQRVIWFSLYHVRLVSVMAGMACSLSAFQRAMMAAA